MSKVATVQELSDLWPEGWLGRRVRYTGGGSETLGSYVWVIPRKAGNALEIYRAASFTRLAANGNEVGAIQVIWYWDDPADLGVRRVGDSAGEGLRS